MQKKRNSFCQKESGGNQKENGNPRQHKNQSELLMMVEDFHACRRNDTVAQPGPIGQESRHKLNEGQTEQKLPASSFDTSSPNRNSDCDVSKRKQNGIRHWNMNS